MGAGRIVIGIGDDGAVWRPSRSHLSVVTTDALVDGVHFVRAAMAAADIGYRAMASNLSDAAAMGARPVLATVALGVPRDATEAWLLECYRGLDAAASEARCRIVGGDIVRADQLFVAITVIGEVAAPRLRTRDGVRVGDVWALTGPLGASRAGLATFESEPAVDSATKVAVRRAYLRPRARVAEGRWLAASTHVHAMMDVSDGLAIELARMARASGCGAVLERVPIDPAAAVVAAALGADPAAFGLAGGEEFELLVAVANRSFDYLAARFAQRFGQPLIRVGRAVAGSELALLDAAGVARPLEPAGWDHLRD